MNILGVRITTQSNQDVRDHVRAFLHDREARWIFTPNPEMLVDAQKDRAFRDILNQSAINICDGMGVFFASGMKLHRYSGIDLMVDICKIAAEEKQTVFLLGSGSSAVVKKATHALEKQIPGIEIAGYHPGIQYDLSESGTLAYDEAQHTELMDTIKKATPDIIFVALGHNKQERWIASFARDVPSVKIAMGVGGSFDTISGSVRRAPKVMRTLGLEWFWRLLLEPKRIRRIWKAVVLFPILVIKKTI